MRKIYFLTISLLFLVSCTDEDLTQVQTDAHNTSTKRYAAPPGGIRYIPDPTKLQKVVYFPGTIISRTFNFYASGLLKNVQNETGVVIQDFFYTNTDLTVSHEYSNNGFLLSTRSFTYDANHLLTNTSPLFHFDAAISAYVWEPASGGWGGELFYVNQEKLLVGEEIHFIDFDDNDQPVNYTLDGMRIYYNEQGNANGYDGGSQSYIEGHHAFDDHTNPLKAGMLAISRAYAIIGFGPSGDRWYDAQYISTNNVVETHHSLEDPESSTFSYSYNDNGLPVEVLINYYYNGEFEQTLIYARYYYQGDVIP